LLKRHCCRFVELLYKPDTIIQEISSVATGTSGLLQTAALVIHFFAIMMFSGDGQRGAGRSAQACGDPSCGRGQLQSPDQSRGDEEGTPACLRNVRRSLIDLHIAAYRGRIVKTTGDGFPVQLISSWNSASFSLFETDPVLSAFSQSIGR
jgi:hypothetical protein